MTSTEFINIYPKNANEILCPDGVNFYVVLTDRLEYDIHTLSFDDALKNEFVQTWIDGMEVGRDGLETDFQEEWLDDEKFGTGAILS